MSKPLPPDQAIPHLPPAEQVKQFADLYRASVNSVAHARIRAATESMHLTFSDDELLIIAALDTPGKVQEFLNTQLYYNYDHASVETEETAMPPRRVLQTGLAHCFEGAMFALAVNYLHGHNPRWVLLEASQDSEHNLIVWRDPRTGLYGCNAHSGYQRLLGQPARFPTIRAIAEFYAPHYYSDHTLDPQDLTLVGFSDEFDLIAKFGTAWIATEEPLWDIYYTYIDDTWRFHYLTDDPGKPHLYPVIRALKENWIRIDAQDKPFVSVNDLPLGAQTLWRDFWGKFGPKDGPHPRGAAREIEKAFMRATGTTPIDLEDNAFDLQFFLAAGYRVEQLMTG